MLETADIELLVTLAKTGLLAKAAERMGVHHATAFRRLNALEERWGTRLFERLAHAYVPTEAGAAAVVRAGELRTRLLDMEGELRNHDASLRGRVRLSTSDGLAARFLPTHIASLGLRFPDIQIDLLVDNRLADLNEREIDVAVRPAKRLTGRLVGRRAANMEFALYAAPTYVEKHGMPGGLRPDFKGHVFCGFHESIEYFSTAVWLKHNLKAGRVGFRSNHLSAMLGWAGAGGGIAILPCVLGETEPSLRRVLGPVPAMTVGLWLCTHPHIRNVAKVRAVLDGLHDLIAADGGNLTVRTG